jgi:ligand-binding sensor domain-containing protein
MFQKYNPGRKNLTNPIKEQNSNSDRKSKPLWIGTVIVVVALLLILGATGIKKEYDARKPIDGFTAFLPDTDICSIALFKGDVWAGGVDGLFVLRGIKDFQEEEAKSNQYYGKKQIYKSEEIGNYRYVKAVLSDGKRIWVGHDRGLTLIEGSKIIDFTDKNGLPDRRVNALCLDSKGTLWVGTWGGVVTMKNMNVEKTYTTKDGLIADMVNVIKEDSTGGMWFGSYVAPRGGISVFYNNKWQRFSTGEGLIHANINAITELNDKSILTGGGLYTKGGGTRFIHEGGSWKIKGYLQKEDGLAGAKIRSLMQDSKSRIWVGSEYEGLAVLKQIGENELNKALNNGASQAGNNAISRSGENRVSQEEKSGASTVENNGEMQSEILTKKTGLPDNEVKVIVEAPDKSVWVGTRNGIVRIE